MKRKILSVLAVLVAVLMSTVVLTACEKAPAGLENGGEPSVSESAAQGGEPSVSESADQGGEASASESASESGEDGELYEFVASEKAAAQVQGIAEVLGGYDFVGLSGVQST